MLVDFHCHAHELEDLEKYSGIIMVAVSDDYESSVKTLLLSEKHPNIIPAIGLHPWSLDKAPVEEAYRVSSLLDSHDVRILGEIGLDKRFKPHTWDKQLEVFRIFLREASEHGLAVNLHAPGAWRETLREVLRYEPPVASFHWYTGPLNTLRELVSVGYYVSINPSARIQAKHRMIAREAPLTSLLTESDAPYNYRGIRLDPLMVRESIMIIAEEKELDAGAVEKQVWSNFKNIASKIGLRIRGVRR